LANRPASEDLRGFGDVFLCVSAVNPESVKLHQLAAVVFVEAGAVLFGLSLLLLLRVVVAVVVLRVREWALLLREDSAIASEGTIELCVAAELVVVAVCAAFGCL